MYGLLNQALLMLPSLHRKTSQKPRAELISQFKHSFDGIISRRNSDVPCPPRPHSQDDINFVPGGCVIDPVIVLTRPVLTERI